MFYLESSPLYYSITIYIVMNIILFTLKPKIFFSDVGVAKGWGVGEEKVLFPSFIISLILSIISFFVMSLYFDINE